MIKKHRNEKMEKISLKKDKFIKDILIKALVRDGSPVYLNVYHLSPVNYVIQILGCGFFHTTIEVNDIEYSFGGTNKEGSGIFYNKFGEGSEKIKLKEKIYLGNTLYDDHLIEEMLKLYIPYWLGTSYDPFMKNCNHFTYFLGSKLLNTQALANYPIYINRISEYATCLNLFYSPLKRIYGKIAYQPDINDNNIIGKTNFSSQIFKKQNELDMINNLNCAKFQDVELQFDEDKFGDSKDLNNIHLSHQTFCTGKEREMFFISFLKKNIFLVSFTVPKKEGEFLSQLSLADKLLFLEDKITEALNIYQRLLNIIDKQTDFQKKIKKFLKIKSAKYRLKDKNRKNILIKLKILHCIYLIFYKEKLIKNQEVVLNTILSLNPDDYYAIFELAYVKFKENKIPECEQLLQNNISVIQNPEIKSFFNQFIKHIENLEF